MEQEMTFLDHLGELRDRIFRAVVALAVGTLIGLLMAETVLGFIIAPYQRQLLVTSPTESLTNVFVVAVTVGAALSMPIVVYQLLAFIMPGLENRERRWIFLGVPAATLLFVIGGLFAYYIMLPPAVGFLTGIFPSVFKYELKLEDYVPFVMGIVFWIGVAFQMPLVVFVAAKANVVSARVLLRNWRYAVVVIAVIAALITPTPDPLNMSLVMAPLLLLFGISVGLAALARRGKTVPAVLDPGEFDSTKSS